MYNFVLVRGRKNRRKPRISTLNDSRDFSIPGVYVRIECTAPSSKNGTIERLARSTAWKRRGRKYHRFRRERERKRRHLPFLALWLYRAVPGRAGPDKMVSASLGTRCSIRCAPWYWFIRTTCLLIDGECVAFVGWVHRLYARSKGLRSPILCCLK